MSIWWLIIPALVYALLTFNLVNTLALVAIAVGLKIGQTRPEVPEHARRWLPLLQVAFVFVFLGGSVIAVAVVVIAAVAAFRYRFAVIEALEPWWQIQERISADVRRLVAIGVCLVIGFSFGSGAAGNEWTYTFLSFVVAAVATFFILFTPPTRLRKRASRKPP